MNNTEGTGISHRKTGAEAARVEQQRADLTLDSIGDAVLSVDVLGRVTYLSPVAERVPGWIRQEAEGRPLTEVMQFIDATTREPT
jgi:PAS domain S-box-containing protein